MARTIGSSPKRPRISVDVDPELRHRLRLSAAKHDLTVGQDVVGAIEDRLRQDADDDVAGMLTLTAMVDPVLAELWDNPQDAVYDRL